MEKYLLAEYLAHTGKKLDVIIFALWLMDKGKDRPLKKSISEWKVLIDDFEKNN